jgi:hypothetical protein
MDVSLAHKVVTPGIIVWDLEIVPDLTSFAAENDLVGKSNVEIREAKFPTSEKFAERALRNI